MRIPTRPSATTCGRGAGAIRCVAWLAAMLGGGAAGGRAVADGIVDLGVSAGFTLAQPTVQTRIGTFDTWLTEYLLDTGASGIVVGQAASQELRDAGLQTVATYYDFGIAGTEATRVSAPYDFRFAGTDGVPLTLPATRIQTSNGNFGFYSGIAGMPLMIDRTVGLDLANQADFSNGGFGGIGVEFGSGPLTARPHQYSVPLTMRLFPMTGQENPTDPLPVYAPLPFATVEVQYGRNRREGSFLVDTGAMLSVLSSSVALDLGLDADGNGSLEDNAVDFVEVAGVGGSVLMPLFTVDAVSLRAADGVDLMTRTMTVGVLDIDAAVPGVIGVDLLNSGWDLYGTNIFLGLPAGPAPAIDRVDFDFRGASTTLQAEMRLTLNADADAFVARGPITLAPVAGGQSQAEFGLTHIGGTGPLTVNGTGAVILDAMNTLTGTTTVQSGTLRIAAANALLGSPTLVQAGGVLEVAAGLTARLPSLTLAGGTVSAAALAVDGTGGIASLVIASGSVAGAPALTVGMGGTVVLPETGRQVVAVQGLSVAQEAGGGCIDLGTGRIEIAAGGITQADLRADLLAARNGGRWDGPTGIGSRAAGSGSGRAVGYRVLDSGTGAATVAWAAFGDVNLDGRVTFADISLINNAGLFGAAGSAADWYEGDFNYDGRVTITDITLLNNAGLYGAGSYLPAAALSLGMPETAATIAAVPEPSSAALATAACIAAGIMQWRRRGDGCRPIALRDRGRGNGT